MQSKVVVKTGKFKLPSCVEKKYFVKRLNIIFMGRLIIRKFFAVKKLCQQKIHTYNNLHFANCLIIVHLKEGDFYCTLVIKALLWSSCFSACMAVHFSRIKLNNPVRFNLVSGPFKGVKIPVAHGSATLAVSFNIWQGLKCWCVPLTPTLTMWLLRSNCIIPLLFLPSHHFNNV